MGFGSDFKNAARTALDLVSAEGQADRLKFTRYSGSAITSALLTTGSIASVKPEEVVVLEVNPTEIGYSKPKIITKVPTSAPERFIVYDWGTDLTVMSIQGNTGNMLPGIIKSGGDPFKTTLDTLAAKVSPGASSILGGGLASKTAAALTNNVLLNNLSYTELISMSPKYKTFKRLEEMYDNFDSSDDLLLLEIGGDTLRGYFLDFSFTQSSNSPWNWVYTLTFVQLMNITKFLQKGDGSMPAKSSDGKTAIDNS